MLVGSIPAIGLDEEPNVIHRDDYYRDMVDYGFSSVVDFFIALGIFLLIRA
jgi:hypothetical protein